MKKLLCLMACVCGLMSAYAQKTAAEKACVAEVRKMYQEAKAMMAENDKHEETQNDMVVTVSSMEPAVGGQVVNYHYYFNIDYSEEANQYVSKPYFVTKKFNVTVRNYYLEYLYDPDSVTLRFVFAKWQDYSGETVEERYYFDKDGRMVWYQVKNTDEVQSADDLKHQSDRILNGFFSLKG